MRCLTDIIKDATEAKTSGKRAFYLHCKLIVEEYPEDKIVQQKKNAEKNIRIYMKHRKKTVSDMVRAGSSYGFARKTARGLYKSELKTERRYLKGLKYILNETNKKRRKTTNCISTACTDGSGRTEACNQREGQADRRTTTFRS